MRIKSLFIPIYFLVGVGLLLLLFAFSTIKNAQNCVQFVYDTFELSSGIDIPKQKGEACHYIESQQTRTGIYQVENMDEFILTYQLSIVQDPSKDLLWNHTALQKENYPLPQTNDVIYRAAGKDANHQWQCILDKNSGQLWFEIQWL